MPLPTFTKLGPSPTFDDLVIKVNTVVGELTNLMLNLDSLNVVSVTADHVDTGTLDANLVTIRSDLTAGAYVQIDGNGMVINNGTINTLEADINGEITATGITLRNDLTGGAYVQIDNTGMTINNGTVDTLTADVNGDVTMTSATIRSLATGERVELDSTGLHTYDAFGFERLTIGTAPVEGVKAVTFRDTTGTAQSVMTYDTETVDGASRTGQYITAHSSYLLFSDDGDFRVQNSASAGFRAIGAGTPQMNDGFSWLDIAEAGVATSSHVQGDHNHGIPSSTTLATTSDGVTVDGMVTFVASGGFTHSHTQN